MSILNTSVSGMLANTSWLSSISQNVSNSNTTGYKNVETEFSALVDEAATAAEPGMGVTTSLRTLNSLQGSVVGTSTNTDLAVQGAGFFVVADASGTLQLTRNGSFAPDTSGNLVNSSGYYLMGAPADSNGAIPPFSSLSSLSKVNVTSAGLLATPTTSGVIAANLPSTAVPVVAANLPSANTASSVYTAVTSLVTYDNLGGAHQLDIYFANTGTNSWEATVFDHSAAAASGAFPYSSGPLATQMLTFNAANGSLSSGSPISVAVPGGQTMSLSLSNMTQLAAAFSVTSGTANGNAPATLTGVSFGTDGKLSFQYSNGASRVAYQIPLGNVPSPDNLTTLNGGVFSANSLSGEVSLGAPGSAGYGPLVPSALEASTVDLATELTSMIEAQSAYQANSKVFQTGANILDVLNHLTP